MKWRWWQSFIMNVGSLTSDSSLSDYTALVEKEEADEDALHEIVNSDSRLRRLDVSATAKALTDTFGKVEDCKQSFAPCLENIRGHH